MTVARRPPYTADYVCTVHKRPGSDEEENFCAATLFVLATDPRASEEAAAPVPPLKPRQYKARPEPKTVHALPSGSLMMVSLDSGPVFSMTRDEFFARYEEVEPEADPKHAEGALDRMEKGDDAEISQADAESIAHEEQPTPVEHHRGRHHGKKS